jgi:hypothetical protein
MMPALLPHPRSSPPGQLHPLPVGLCLGEILEVCCMHPSTLHHTHHIPDSLPAIRGSRTRTTLEPSLLPGWEMEDMLCYPALCIESCGFLATRLMRMSIVAYSNI